MYVYENKAHEACVVLDGVIPLETPDFVIKLDAEKRQLVVNGTAIDSNIPAEADAVAEVAETEVEPEDEGDEAEEEEAEA